MRFGKALETKPQELQLTYSKLGQQQQQQLQ